MDWKEHIFILKYVECLDNTWGQEVAQTGDDTQIKKIVVKMITFINIF